MLILGITFVEFSTLASAEDLSASLKDVNPADFDRSQALDGKLYGLLADKDYAEALPAAQEQEALLEKMYGPDNPAVAVNLDNLATIYRNLGRNAEAEPLAKRSQAIRDANKAIDQINR